jgi:hypothetical protein
VINADIVRLTVEFANQTEDLLVTFDKQQRLIGLDSPSSGDIEELATNFINILADEDYALARAYISPLLRVEFIPTRIQRGWESLLNKNGSFQKIVNMKTIPSDTPNVPNVVIAEIQLENQTDDLFLFFNDEKRIVNIDHSD